MAIIDSASGPFQALYISLYGNTTFTRTNYIGTNGYVFQYDKPKKFVKATGLFEQIGNATVGLDLSFLSDDPDGVKIAMTNDITATYQDQIPTTDKVYQVLLIDSFNSESSIFIPKCTSLTHLDLSRKKGEAVQVDLKMRHEDPNGFVQLYYKRSLSALQTIFSNLGLTWPL